MEKMDSQKTSRDMKWNDVATEPLMGEETSPRCSGSASDFRRSLQPTHGHGLLSHRHIRRLSPWYFHGTLALFYTSIFVAFMMLNTSRSQSQMRLQQYSSAMKGLLQWEPRHFPTEIDHNPLVGKPRDELQLAWHNLLQNDNIKVPKAYLDELGLKSIYTKDGLHGIASLSVYHSIHCLKKIRYMMYKELYHDGKSQEAMHRETRHADHCLEYVREYVMCQPDLSLVTFRWINETAQHPQDPKNFYPTNFDASKHTCAKWAPLEAWSAEHTFNLSDLESLERPYEANV